MTPIRNQVVMMLSLFISICAMTFCFQLRARIDFFIEEQFSTMARQMLYLHERIQRLEEEKLDRPDYQARK